MRDAPCRISIAIASRASADGSYAACESRPAHCSFAKPAACNWAKTGKMPLSSFKSVAGCSTLEWAGGPWTRASLHGFCVERDGAEQSR
eukprot:3356659-Pyramimonas_sp.AAC.1